MRERYGDDAMFLIAAGCCSRERVRRAANS